MANEQQPTRGTLGLISLTMNAIGLIAPSAFLLTFLIQSLCSVPMAGCSMWFGILFLLFLCLTTAVSYGGLSRFNPGSGYSYLKGEQAFLYKTHDHKSSPYPKPTSSSLTCQLA